MIPDNLYTSFYLLFISIISITVVFNNLSSNKNLKNSFSNPLNILIPSFIVLYMGFRDPYSKFFGDTIAYTKLYEKLSLQIIPFEFQKDIIFYSIMNLFSTNFSVTTFYLFTSSIYVFLPYYAFKKMDPKNYILIFIAFILSFEFWAYGVNGIRHGLATSFFIYALVQRRNYMKFLLFVLSFSFHSSTIIMIFAYFISLRLKDIKLLLIIWLLCIFFTVITAGSFTDFLYSNISGFIDDSRISIYMNADQNRFRYQIGFRFDFLLYSLVGVFYAYKYLITDKFDNILYSRISSIYILLNSAWILLMYIPYNNRIAYMSWLFIPYIVFYPIVIEYGKNSNYEFKKLLFPIIFFLSFNLISYFLL